jgi:hypothetical protein
VIVTATAAARVSVGGALGYLILLAIIYVTPGKRQPTARATQRNQVSIARAGPDLADDREIVPPGDRDRPHFASGPDHRLTFADAPASGVGCTDAPSRRGPSPSRRGRARGPATPKYAPESVAELPAVTWVRVGPGKFVRSDVPTAERGRDRSGLKTTTAEVMPSDDSTPEAAAVGYPGDALAAQPEVCAEVHGTTIDTLAVAEPVFCSVARSSEHSAGRELLGAPKRPFTVYTMRRWPWVANPAPRTHRGVRPRGARIRRTSYALRQSTPRAYQRCKQAMRSAFARSTHVQRTLRPRSPPLVGAGAGGADRKRDIRIPLTRSVAIGPRARGERARAQAQLRSEQTRSRSETV